MAGIELLIRLAFVVVVTCTWYGPNQTNGDPYTASWWHNELPEGAPGRVDYEYLGVASASRDIPFGTRVRLEVYDIADWAKGEFDHLIGRSVIVTVVDRMKNNDEDRFDLWPAAAKLLMGPDYQRIGIVYVKIEILGQRDGIDTRIKIHEAQRWPR